MNGVLVIGTRQLDGLAPRGALIALALALADYARSCGLTLHSIRRSRRTNSFSCYLNLCGDDGRAWIVRVSDHRAPHKMGYPIPHFDLVSLDGVSGLVEGKRAIDAMTSGDFAWREPDTCRRIPRRRRKPKVRR